MADLEPRLPLKAPRAARDRSRVGCCFENLFIKFNRLQLRVGSGPPAGGAAVRAPHLYWHWPSSGVAGFARGRATARSDSLTADDRGPKPRRCLGADLAPIGRRPGADARPSGGKGVDPRQQRAAARQGGADWESPRLESNRDLTLRRRVHYPLCYGEGARSIRGPLRPPAAWRPADRGFCCCKIAQLRARCAASAFAPGCGNFIYAGCG